MLEDLQGLTLTTESTAAVAAINRFIQQSLTYGRDAEAAIWDALKADPTCAIANAYAAAYYLAQENRADRQRSLPYLDLAQRHAQHVSEREQLYIRGIQAWATGQIDQAIAYHEAIAEQFPTDLLSIQQGQYHYFYQGNKAGLLQIAQKTLVANSDNPYLLGMLAFGLEQCHQLQQAEKMGRQATERDRQNPWAHHAVAHVLETEERAAEGIAWMQSVADTWESCNSMLYTHNWWHMALFYLKQHNLEEALSLHDTHIWGRAQKHSPKDQVGAISLLLRLQLQGVELARQWHELTPYLVPRIHEHTLPFQDLHYVYALARSQHPEYANIMLVSMVAHAQTLAAAQRDRWLNVAVPAARGLIAHATGNWQEAITFLKPMMPHLWKLGGSHAQRQLFTQVYDAALRQMNQTTPIVISTSAQRSSPTSVQLSVKAS